MANIGETIGKEAVEKLSRAASKGVKEATEEVGERVSKKVVKEAAENGGLKIPLREIRKEASEKVTSNVDDLQEALNIVRNEAANNLDNTIPKGANEKITDVRQAAEKRQKVLDEAAKIQNDARTAAYEEASRMGIDPASDNAELYVQKRTKQMKKERIQEHLKNRTTIRDEGSTSRVNSNRVGPTRDNAKIAEDARKVKSESNKAESRKLFTKSNAQKAVGLGVGGYLVLNMFDQGGQMSNAELYGQQQQYGGY